MSMSQDVVRVSVTRLNRVKKESKVKAFANIDIINGDTIISIDGVKVIDTGNETGPWVGMPCTSYVDKNGKTQWPEVVTLSPNVMFAVKDAVVEAYQDRNFEPAKSLKPVRKAAVARTQEPAGVSGFGSEEDIPF